jgi:hypothetical protein
VIKKNANNNKKYLMDKRISKFHRYLGIYINRKKQFFTEYFPLQLTEIFFKFIEAMDDDDK